MRRHAVEALGAATAAAILTLVIAAPVVRAPDERLFGAEIVGRHHDPFTVMQQFSRPLTLGVYAQPVTDLTGAAIARVTGAVAAYNWLVLLSFPLAAAAACLLARHLALPPAAAVFAGLLFAFSPFHLAQAAYHPHIAQIQWLPLYLLALWRCLDRGTWPAAAWLAAAAAAAALSNFYGGMIAAVITPIALGAYWAARGRFALHPARRLVVTGGTLAALAIGGAAVLWWTAPAVLRDPSVYAFAREDLSRFSASWWSYLVPAVSQPWLGESARRIWSAAQVDDALLEQQVGLGWSVIALAAIAIAPKRDARAPALMLAAIAVAAFVCSLAPERTVFGLTLAAPSALLYTVAPMFRAYARFGVIVQLMAALLAAIGATQLLARRTPASRGWCAALVMLATAEYAVRPSAMSRDALPTAAHRWVVQQAGRSRAFDCEPLTLASSSIAWLTDGRIALADTEPGGCAEPQLAARLWASGFTQLIVRDTWERAWLREHGAAEGLLPAARFADADVLAIRPREFVYTSAVTGFWPREHGDGRTWRWMGADASWTIVSPAPQPRVTLEIDLHAFHRPRPLAVRLDAGDAHLIEVACDDRTYRIGPLALSPGAHLLTFHSPAPATRADAVTPSGDGRALAFSVGAWKWSVE